MPYDHLMRQSPGGQLLWRLLRARIIGAGALRPVGARIIALRQAS